MRSVRTLLLLFGIIVRGYCQNISVDINTLTTSVSLEITDCGDGRLGSFEASINPNSIIFTTEPAPTVWIGGRFSFTEEARILASNITVAEFHRDLRVFATLEMSSFLISPIPGIDNVEACGESVSPQFCDMAVQAMNSSLKNVPVFLPIDMESKHIEGSIVMLIKVLKSIPLPQKEIFAVLKVMMKLHEKELVCFRYKVKANSNEKRNEPVSEHRRINFNNTFDTSKIITMVNNNQSLSCPENSKEISNSSCECNYPSSGPLCLFQCRLDEVHVPGCHGMENETMKQCKFSDREYIKYCLKEKNIPVLNDNVTVEVISLNHINIKWNLINSPAWYRYELILNDENGILGKIVNDAFYMKGIETNYKLHSLCMEKSVSGVDCRYITYEKQICFYCPDLDLIPFHNYRIVLNIGTGSSGDSVTMVEYMTYTTNFATFEVAPDPPKIINAVLNEDKSLVYVDWMVLGRCPGYIRRYELSVSCDTDSAISLGDFHYDCRNNSQVPTLNGTIPTACKSEDINVKLRIETSKSMSDESEPFLLPYDALSTLATVGIALGAFIIAVVIGLIIFFYYYKRHVKTYQGVYRTVTNLLHSRRNREVGQSFRRPTAPARPLPNAPTSQGIRPHAETPFETLGSSEAGTPCPHQSTNAIDPPSSPATETQNGGYTTAEWNGQLSNINDVVPTN